MDRDSHAPLADEAPESSVPPSGVSRTDEVPRRGRTSKAARTKTVRGLPAGPERGEAIDRIIEATSLRKYLNLEELGSHYAASGQTARLFLEGMKGRGLFDYKSWQAYATTQKSETLECDIRAFVADVLCRVGNKKDSVETATADAIDILRELISYYPSKERDPGEGRTLGAACLRVWFLCSRRRATSQKVALPEWENNLERVRDALKAWRERIRTGRRPGDSRWRGKKSPLLATFLGGALVLLRPSSAAAATAASRWSMSTASTVKLLALAAAIGGGILAAERCSSETRPPKAPAGEPSSAARQRSGHWSSARGAAAGPREARRGSGRGSVTISVRVSARPMEDRLPAPGRFAELNSWLQWSASALVTSRRGGYVNAALNASSFPTIDRDGRVSISAKMEGALGYLLMPPEEQISGADGDWSCSGAADQSAILIECAREGVHSILMLGWRAEAVDGTPFLIGNAWLIANEHPRPLNSWLLFDPSRLSPRLEPLLRPPAWYSYGEPPREEYRRICSAHGSSEYCRGSGTWDFPSRPFRDQAIPRPDLLHILR